MDEVPHAQRDRRMHRRAKRVRCIHSKAHVHLLGARETKEQSSCSERHADVLARRGRKVERQKEEGRNGRVERESQAGTQRDKRHTDTHTHTLKSLLLGYPQLSPPMLKGSCAVHLCPG